MTTKSRGKQDDPYTIFSAVYDQPDHAQVADAFFQHVRNELRVVEEGTWILDLACGTGVVTDKIADLGLPVIGVDRSSAMLKRARERCRAYGGMVRFKQADLADFHVNKECRIATACGDVANHIPSSTILTRIFRNVHRELASGGMLCFDALNRFCFEQYWTGKTYFMEGESESGDIVMECDWDARKLRGECHMTCYVQDDSGRYTKRQFTLFEYLHEDDVLENCLRKAGFRVERTEWSPWPDQHLEPAMDRNFWRAYKD